MAALSIDNRAEGLELSILWIVSILLGEGVWSLLVFCQLLQKLSCVCKHGQHFCSCVLANACCGVVALPYILYGETVDGRNKAFLANKFLLPQVPPCPVLCCWVSHSVAGTGGPAAL